MLGVALRPGLLGGSICGIVGVVVLFAAGVAGVGLVPWLVALLVPLLAGVVAPMFLARRADPALRQGDLVRAGAIGGAVSELWIGVLLSILVGLVIGGGLMDAQIGDLLAQNGLSAESASTLSGLVLACAGCFFLFFIPAVGAGLGALTAWIYSLARPIAPARTG